jgi:hypothetical protein
MGLDSSGEEHALYAGGKFKGRCRICGVYGHKGNNCWQRGQNKKFSGGRGNGSTPGSSSTGRGNFGSDRKSNGKCHYCQKEGHQIKDFYKKKKDEASETAAVASPSSGLEHAEMMCLGFEIFDTEKACEEVPRLDAL